MVPEIFAFLGTDTARPDFEITTFKYHSNFQNYIGLENLNENERKKLIRIPPPF